MADRTEERVRTGEATERLLRRAGFRTSTTALSGAYVVDFQVEPTESWEQRNLRSAVRIGRDGRYGEVAVRPPTAPQGRRADMRAALEAASAEAGPAWSYFIREPDHGDGFLTPHIYRDPDAPPATPRQVVSEVQSAVRAYRRAVGAGSDFDFS